MSAKRTERLLNLVICLLATRRYLTKAQIRRAVPQYADCPTTEAFERMFERDKDELRDMGIPLQTGSHDPAFDDEVGYRIDRSTYALPELTFEPDEMAVLGLAAKAWQQASLSRAAGTALLKLRAAGVDPDESAIVGVDPRVKAAEPAFAALWAAVRDARPVRFTYRSSHAGRPQQRRVEPWGILSRRGRWYVVGHDRDRAAPRVFRLSRIVGDVRLDGPRGSVVVPDGVDVRAHLHAVLSELPDEPHGKARIRVRDGAGYWLRRRATAVAPGGEGWDVLDLPYADEEALAEELTSYGASVVALDPPELRLAIVRRLTVLAANHPVVDVPDVVAEERA
jgi:proteasome accessory factor B